VNPNISFEVFIHKADGLSDDAKIGMKVSYNCLDYRAVSRIVNLVLLLLLLLETQREIQQQAMDLLRNGNSHLEGGNHHNSGASDIHLSFYLTSIYDHSIFEGFSKVIQKLIPQLPTLENLLDILISNCRMEKAFLIDVVSKIYIATDSSPVDMQTYELCSDMIDVVVDVSCIYG
jgi:Ras-related GTP-binding protein C/D